MRRPHTGSLLQVTTTVSSPSPLSAPAGRELDYPSHMKVTYGHLAVTGESAECKTDSRKSGISWPGKSYNFSKK